MCTYVFMCFVCEVMVNKFRRTRVFGKDKFKAKNDEIEINFDFVEKKEFGTAKV